MTIERIMCLLHQRYQLMNGEGKLQRIALQSWRFKVPTHEW
ncbi:unnamed protein product [Rhodiola kirilowii]